MLLELVGHSLIDSPNHQNTLLVQAKKSGISVKRFIETHLAIMSLFTSSSSLMSIADSGGDYFLVVEDLRVVIREGSQYILSFVRVLRQLSAVAVEF